MNQPSKRSSDWVRRWFGLLLGIGLCVLLLSIYSPGQSLWFSALFVTGAIVVLVFGIQEFVRKIPNDDA
jgi:hypothetical protein